MKAEVLKSLQGKLTQGLMEHKDKQNGGSEQSVTQFTWIWHIKKPCIALVVLLYKYVRNIEIHALLQNENM